MRIPLAIVMGSVLFYCSNPRRENPFDVAGLNWHPPSVTAMNDTTVAINDSFYVHAAGSDANGRIVKFFWALDGVNYKDSTDSGRIRWAFPTPGGKTIQVKARDNDGVYSLKSDSVVITVHSYAPVVTAMNDAAVTINDSVDIHASGIDTNGTVVKYIWARNGSVYADTTTAGALKVAYPDSGRKVVRVKGIDDDGLASQPDSCIVRVRLDPPVVTAMNDTIVSFAVCSSVTVTVSAHDVNAGGSVVKYYWDRGLNGWDDSTAVNSYTITTTTGGPVWVRWQVRDDDNLLSLIDTFKVVFNRPPSRPIVSAPISWISFNWSTGKGMFSLAFSASDPDGAADTLTYTLSTGPSAGSMTQAYSGRSTACSIASVDSSAIVYWKLLVRDLFGDSAVDSGTFVAPPLPSWYALGSGTNSTVQALKFDRSGNLYAGGSFTTAGSIAANHIAKWDGSTWSALGSGTNSTVQALEFDRSGNLYTGGYFNTAGGNAANYIAKWNGTAWSALGSGTNGVVESLAFDSSGNLYAGGSFTTAGGITANHIAKWNGSAWSTLGSGITTSGTVWALACDSTGNLYVGGYFSTAGGIAANNIAKWSGSAWSALGTGTAGTSPFVGALTFDRSGNLYAGGYFTYAGGNAANYIAKWDGSTWSALGSGMNNYVRALACDGSGNLYAGWYFTIAGGVPANYIARWDGSAWSALGSGTNSYVNALAYDGSGNLYAGGEFTVAGGNAANYIAEWK